MGVVANNGFGACGVSWGDILAWAKLTETILPSREYGVLHEMSAAYAVTLEQAKNPACPPPWEPTLEQRRKAVSEQLANILNAMVSKSDG